MQNKDFTSRHDQIRSLKSPWPPVEVDWKWALGRRVAIPVGMGREDPTREEVMRSTKEREASRPSAC